MLLGSSVSYKVREGLLASNNFDALDFSKASNGYDNCVVVHALEHARVHEDVGRGRGVDTLNGHELFGVVVLVKHDERLVCKRVPEEVAGRYFLHQPDVSLGLCSHVHRHGQWARSDTDEARFGVLAHNPHDV